MYQNKEQGVNPEEKIKTWLNILSVKTLLILINIIFLGRCGRLAEAVATWPLPRHSLIA